jgi:hypothetical protein
VSDFHLREDEEFTTKARRTENRALSISRCGVQRSVIPPNVTNHHRITSFLPLCLRGEIKHAIENWMAMSG